MKTEYSPDDYLLISGIQHFAFCRRQWALIHIEKQWNENVLTVEGKILHSRVDDPFYYEKRKDTLITRSMYVSSRTLGITGMCDVVEFVQNPAGVPINGREGKYAPCPIEYKRGKEKKDDIDTVQLCAQALCLEEMFCTEISYGYMYYGEIRQRVKVELDEPLRSKVRTYISEMHELFARGHTPKAKASKACRSCSLGDICLPKLSKIKQSPGDYIKKSIEV